MTMSITELEPEWLEQKAFGELRVWQLIFLMFAGIITIIIALCCCIRFRVPRTKQQIEADYQRRIITKSFRQELEKIQNTEMNNLDLKTALDLVRADFKGDDEEKEQNISIINVPRTTESPDKTIPNSPHYPNVPETVEKTPVMNRGNLGNRLIALVRMSKQKENTNTAEC